MKKLLFLIVLLMGIYSMASATLGPPLFDALGPQTVNENASLVIHIRAVLDANDTVTMSSPNLPANAVLFDSGTVGTPKNYGSGTITFDPGYTQSGTYSITVYCTSIAFGGGLADTLGIGVTVYNTNRKPTLTAISEKTVAENASIIIRGISSDPDAADIAGLVTSASGIPTRSSWADSAAGIGKLTYNPNFTDSGHYSFYFVTTDTGGMKDSVSVSVVVTNVNQSPVLTSIGAKTGTENTADSFYVRTTDADADSVIYSVVGLPGGSSFSDSLTGGGIFRWTPGYSDSGVYLVHFRAWDKQGGVEVDVDSEIVNLTISNTNRAPVLTSIGAKNIAEGSALTFSLWSTDADTNAITYSVSTGTLPSGAALTDSGTGGGKITWTPGYTQAGSHTPHIISTDALGAVDSEIVTITVWNTSRPPTLFPVLTAKKTVSENGTLVDTIHSADVDGDPLTITHGTLPSRLTHTDSIFTYAPNYTDSGHYTVEFYVSDTTGVGALKDTISVIYTVTNTNRAPVLGSIGAKSVDEGAALTIHPWTTDADADSIIYSVVGLPTGAVFTDSLSGGGKFVWTPTYSQAGVYNVHFRSYDKNLGVVALNDTEIVAVTVADVPLVIVTLEDSTIHPDSTVRYHVWSNTTNTVTLTAIDLPVGATFYDSGTGGGVFEWVPDYLDNGIYTILFASNDLSSSADTDTVIITIEDATQTLGYLINSINTSEGAHSIVCQWGRNGFTVTGGYGTADVDTSDPLFIRDYSLYYTTYRASMLGTGAHSRVRIYGQTSTNGTYWATQDSVYPTEDDTLPYVKTWSIPKVDWFRTITKPWVNNDTSRVWLEHSFREKQ